MSDDQTGNIDQEFSEFGKNLKKAFNAAWESEERIQAQKDIEAGINNLGKALENFASSFSTSDTGQQMKEEMDEFGQRLRSGEVADKAREELLKALKALNKGLQNATEHFSSDQSE